MQQLSATGSVSKHPTWVHTAKHTYHLTNTDFALIYVFSWSLLQRVKTKGFPLSNFYRRLYKESKVSSNELEKNALYIIVTLSIQETCSNR